MRVDRVTTDSPNGPQIFTRMTFVDSDSKHAIEVLLGDDHKADLVRALTGIVPATSMPESP
jgi:hypothetical protein